jgi:ABC-type uncharacterized transport system permease subunit
MSIELLAAAALIAGAPILLAALGELLAERAGILNLGVEGTMLVGAVSGFAGTMSSGSVWIGLALAILAGGLFGFTFAFLTILGAGLSAFLGKRFIGQPAPTTVPKPDFGLLADIPFVGPALFRHDVLVYMALVLAVATAFYIRRTRYGVILKALGESPDVLDTLGISVVGLRYAYVIVGAALAGLGGAYLSLAFTPSWIENMTAGRGWIAIALVIFSGWRPMWLLFGAYLFGFVDALGFRMQVSGAAPIDPHFLNMLPYLATLGVLMLASTAATRRRFGAPRTLGVAYDRESR